MSSERSNCEAMDEKRKAAICYTLVAGIEQQWKRRHCECWSKFRLLQRKALHNDLDLLEELKQGGIIADFKNYLRMDDNVFQILLNKVAAFITEKNTVMREAIATNFDEGQEGILFVAHFWNSLLLNKLNHMLGKTGTIKTDVTKRLTQATEQFIGEK